MNVSTGGVRYKRGIVSATKPGFARVRFDDIDGLISTWLPVVYPKTQNDKICWTLDVSEQVACLMDEHLEDGCIVGAIYSQADIPPVTSADKLHLLFKDGGSFEYDRVTGAMTIVCKGAVTIKAPSVTLDTPETTCKGKLTVQGDVNVSGAVIASDNVKAGTISLQTHIHPTPSGPSSPPQP